MYCAIAISASLAPWRGDYEWSARARGGGLGAGGVAQLQSYARTRCVVQWSGAIPALAAPEGGAHRDHAMASAALSAALSKHIGELSKMSEDALKEERYQKFRALGEFTEEEVLPGENEPKSEVA